MFGMLSFKERYDNIINFVLHTFIDYFGDQVVFINKQVAIEHMGYFKIQYKYLPLRYDIVPFP